MTATTSDRNTPHRGVELIAVPVAAGAVIPAGVLVVATKQIGSEVFRCVYQVRPGKKNRALSLLSLVIKTGK